MAEIKAGYKNTDIGVIPKDWDVDKIKNICQMALLQIFANSVACYREESFGG